MTINFRSIDKKHALQVLKHYLESEIPFEIWQEERGRRNVYQMVLKMIINQDRSLYFKCSPFEPNSIQLNRKLPLYFLGKKYHLAGVSQITRLQKREIIIDFPQEIRLAENRASDRINVELCREFITVLIQAIPMKFTILDISRSGISFLCNKSKAQFFRPGDFYPITHLFDINIQKDLEIEIIRTAEHSDSEVLIGCQFSKRISEVPIVDTMLNNLYKFYESVIGQ